MRFVDSKEKKLTMPEVLHIYYENELHHSEEPIDPKEFMKWILPMTALLAQPEFTSTQIGNTFFMVRRGEGEKESSCILWTMNADALTNVSDNFLEAALKLRKAGVTDIYASYTNAGISRMARTAFSKYGKKDAKLDIEKINEAFKLHVSFTKTKE